MARAVGLSDDRGMTDDARNTLTSFVDAFGRGDLDALTALLADDFVGHVTTADGGCAPPTVTTTSRPCAPWT